MTISESQLNLMRESIKDLLPDTAIIQAPSYPGDGGGGSGTVIYTPISGGTVPCRLDPVYRSSEQVKLIAEREQIKLIYQFTTLHDAPLEVDTQVLIKGQVYRVLVMSKAHSWRVSRRAIVGHLEG